MADDPPVLASLPTHLAALRTASTVLHDAVASSWLGAPVPTCPGWTLLDLVAHLGMVQSWAAAALLGDHEAMSDVELVAEEGRATADPLAWLAERTDHLLTTLEEAADDVEAVVFLKEAPAPRRFWARRQCHEAVVHALDAVAARHARMPAADDAWFDRDLALDGLDELLVGFWQRSRSGPRSDPPLRVLVTPDDADVAWVLDVGPERTVTRLLSGAAASPSAEAVLAGSAVDLYLALWNRGGRVADGAALVPRWRGQAAITW